MTNLNRKRPENIEPVRALVEIFLEEALAQEGFGAKSKLPLSIRKAGSTLVIDFIDHYHSSERIFKVSSNEAAQWSKPSSKKSFTSYQEILNTVESHLFDIYTKTGHGSLVLQLEFVKPKSWDVYFLVEHSFRHYHSLLI
jgi:hypothetical protein